jgi:hypothetical protein
MRGHFDETADDLLVFACAFLNGFFRQVSASFSEAQPCDRFRSLAGRVAQFACEVLPEAPLEPRFGDVGAQPKATEREERRIWSVIECFSALGQRFDASKIRIAASKRS